MDSITRWSMDDTAAKEGAWRKLGDGEQVKVRPCGEISNEDQSEFIVSECQKLGYEVENTPVDELEKIMLQSIAKFVLVDWKGFKDKKGENMPASHANKMILLSQPRFCKRIVTESKRFETFRAKAEGKKVKN